MVLQARQWVGKGNESTGNGTSYIEKSVESREIKAEKEEKGRKVEMPYLTASI